MEELLNKLIQRWWKPLGTKNKVFKVMKTKHNWWYFDWWFWNEICFSLRELVSKESWLRQFCCENQMIRVTENNSLCNWLFWEEIYYDETQTYKLYKNDNYEYWLIESALCDEDKLEQFLLDNIKIS